MPDANKQEAPAAKKQQLESVRSDNFLKIYANSANIETTVWDFNLIFGELTKRGDRVVIEQSVAVTMSPQHAKAFAGILSGNIREYEKMVGEIKLLSPEAAAAQASTPMPEQPSIPTPIGFKNKRLP